MNPHAQEWFRAIRAHDLDALTTGLPGECGAVQSADATGMTLLHAVASWGTDAMARLLLDAGAPVDVADDFRRTPLMHAACAGNAGVAIVLIARGATVDARDAFGMTAADHEEERKAQLQAGFVLPTLGVQ